MCFGCCCFTVAFHNRIFFESFFVVEAKLRAWAKTQTWFHILCWFKRQNSLQFKQKRNEFWFCQSQTKIYFDFLCFENWEIKQRVRVKLGRLRGESSRANSNEPIRSRLDCLFCFASQFCPFIKVLLWKVIFFVILRNKKKVTIRRRIFGVELKRENQRIYVR